MRSVPCLRLGNGIPLDGGAAAAPFSLPAHHLVTHGVIVGMTGSGKTGLVTVTVEEALRAQVPVLMIDVKGDLPDLLLSFPSFSADAFLPWMENSLEPGDDRTPLEVAAGLAREREQGLRGWRIGENDLAAFRAKTSIRVITPGSTAGEPLHVLPPRSRRARWTSPRCRRSISAEPRSGARRLPSRSPS